MKPYLVLGALLAMAACATTSEPGWAGSGAERLNAAFAACETMTEGQSAAAFDVCMAEQGWTRR